MYSFVNSIIPHDWSCFGLIIHQQTNATLWKEEGVDCTLLYLHFRVLDHRFDLLWKTQIHVVCWTILNGIRRWLHHSRLSNLRKKCYIRYL